MCKQVSAGWFTSEEVDSPIVLWWTPFIGEDSNLRTCGEDTCFFTENRTLISDTKVKAGVCNKHEQNILVTRDCVEPDGCFLWQQLLVH